MSSIIEDLNWRYACKEFDPNKKIDPSDIKTLLESLRLSASSYGLQPWKFIRVKSPELRSKLLEHSYKQRQVVDASDLLVLCALSKIEEKNVDDYLDDIANKRGLKRDSLEGLKKMMMFSINQTEDKKSVWADKQVYIALGQLLSVCAQMRIDSCPMEGFVSSKVDEVLGLKAAGLRSVLLCPVGYRSQSDKYSKLKKVRFEYDDIVLTL